MRTIVLEPKSAEFEALLKRRHALGQDLYDEVWQGEYHMAPMARPSHGYVSRQLAVLLDPLVGQAGLVATDPFNLGSANDYRVSDGGVHRELPTMTFVATAALVVEVVSPGDETWQKLDFYAAHSVDELLIADPVKRSVTWLVLHGGRYVEAEYSPLLRVSVAKLTEQIKWPATD